MAVDIEKLIEEFVIPEMEYSPSYEKKGRSKGKGKGKIKAKAQPDHTVTIDEIPEVVLPKTKAEVYEEAKGRLKQKTSAVSRRTKKGDSAAEVAAAAPSESRKPTVQKPVLKTVTIESAARSAEPTLVANPVWVGSETELVPFAWRMPLIPDIAKQSKYYKQAVREAKELLLPVPNDR